ncbi:MAG: hypothetical protein AB7P03_07135 [Kofleriaceae bacterium]
MTKFRMAAAFSLLLSACGSKEEAPAEGSGAVEDPAAAAVAEGAGAPAPADPAQPAPTPPPLPEPPPAEPGPAVAAAPDVAPARTPEPPVEPPAEPPAPDPAPPPAPEPPKPVTAGPSKDGTYVLADGSIGGKKIMTGKKADQSAEFFKANLPPEFTVSADGRRTGPTGNEEHYIRVSRNGREVASIVDRGSGLAFQAFDPIFTTADGIKKGDKLSDVMEKRPDVQCMGKSYPVSNWLALTCKSPKDPKIVYFMFYTPQDKDKLFSERGTAVLASRIANREIVAFEMY